LQLLKEEKVDGAVHSVYVKKVNYHTSLSEGHDVENSAGSKCANSTFYTDLPVQFCSTYNNTLCDLYIFVIRTING